MEALVDRYFNQIEVEDTDFVPVDDAHSDAAYLLLNVPTAMLKDYLALKGQSKELPDGAELWKDTELGRRLRDSDKYHGQGHADLRDIIEFLQGEVYGQYQRLHDPTKIRLSIKEVIKSDED